MKKCLLVAVLTLLIVSICIPAAAQDDSDSSCSGVLLFEGRARASVTNTTAAYGLLVNLSDEPVTLTGGSTSAAEVVEVHSMSISDDVMHMEPLPDGLTIPPHSHVTLEPGGMHLMLINLTARLEAGTTLDLTFEFNGAENIPVSLPVMDIESDMSAEMSSGEIQGGMAGLADDCHGVFVISPWIRPSVTSTGAAYGLIINLTDTDITLTGGSTDAAEVIEIHSVTVDDEDVMHMEPLPNGLTLPPSAYAILQPGGMHLMLVNLTEMLIAGDSIDLTLEFEGADSITLPVPIIDPDADSSDLNHDHMEGMSEHDG
ncbi:MAG TPA: copper chaperone PCu(A)C [Aggregatilineales bacterium]|nr:copper chaperone PCu(A)C [Aggregatilineales bacterium]